MIILFVCLSVCTQASRSAAVHYTVKHTYAHLQFVAMAYETVCPTVKAYQLYSGL